jgi:hypothetical protein
MRRKREEVMQWSRSWERTYHKVLCGYDGHDGLRIEVVEISRCRPAWDEEGALAMPIELK